MVLGWDTLIIIAVISICSANEQSLSNKKILCYYGKWSEERTFAYTLSPKNINATLCTHILYAFELPDLMEGALPTDYLRSLTSEGGADEFIALKKVNPDIKLMLSIGGWKEGSVRFSKMASSTQETEWLVQYTNQFIRHLGFDGLDINWQWPGQREGGSLDDKKNFAEFVKTFRRYFIQEGKNTNREPLILSVVVPPFMEMVERGFDMETIAREVDFMTLLTMDYYSSTDHVINHHSPLHSIPFSFCDKKLTVEATVEHYLKMGIAPDKMILGLPMYGNSYLLESMYNAKLGAFAEDEGTVGFATKNAGSLAYFEICKYIKDYGWMVEYPNVTAMGPFAYYNKNWVAYDDADIIKKKVSFAKEKCLGGIMLWTIDMDDFKGICHLKFPLATAAKEALLNPEKGVSCTSSPTASTLNNNPKPKQTKPFKIVTREKWQAAAPTEEIPKLAESPAPYVIITNTVSSPCENFEECKPAVQNIQSFHIDIDYGDIGYGFLIGGDGNVYEGRGWDLHGAHTLPFNRRSIGIAFIGTFSTVEPPQKQIDAVLRLLDEGVKLGKLTPDYKIFGQRQIIAVSSPGNKLMEIIKKWPHWSRYDPIEDD